MKQMSDRDREHENKQRKKGVLVLKKTTFYILFMNLESGQLFNHFR